MSTISVADRAERVRPATVLPTVLSPSQIAPSEARKTNGAAGTVTEPAIAPTNADPEKFIPVTPRALIDRLADVSAWPPGEAARVRRLFTYLANWRQQSYGAKLLDLARYYEPFDPDSDVLSTRTFSAVERKSLEVRLVDGICDLLKQANYVRIDPEQIDIILTKESHYGLDLHVDLAAFDEIEIYYRGAIHNKASRRSRKSFYLKMEEFDYPVFQRLAILFKLKPEEQRARELAAKTGIDEEKALKRVRKLRGAIAGHINSDNVYIKLFKNIPQADLEMVFPNTTIKFRMFDKIKLGVTAGGGLGVGVAGTITKIAVASNPIALAGAVAGLGGVAVRQAVNFSNQRNKYMVKMAQNLYAHALADNRGVMTLLAERAAEEDIKEEVLLYAILAKEPVHISEIPAVDRAIESYLAKSFGIKINFDVDDALHRLQREGIVTVGADGWLRVLTPDEASAQIDTLWDGYLDKLVIATSVEGVEQEGDAAPVLE